jgi:hypothetical protein
MMTQTLRQAFNQDQDQRFIAFCNCSFLKIFCRQYFLDSTIPQGLAKQADVAFLFYARSKTLILIISAGCTGTPLKPFVTVPCI